MSIATELAVVLEDKVVLMHAPTDGLAGNIASTVVPAILAGGLDELRQAFASSKAFPAGYFEDSELRELVEEAACAYIQACASRNRAPHGIDRLFPNAHDLPDIAHGGGCLLYGPRHVNDHDRFESPVRDADFVLDLDKGVFIANFAANWHIDLVAIQGKDPSAVEVFLSGFDFEQHDGLLEGERLCAGESIPFATAEQSAQWSAQLGEELSRLPDVDPNAIRAPRPSLLAQSGSAPGPREMDKRQVIWRFHPSSFAIVRMLTQSFQHAAAQTGDPELARMLENMHIERGGAHVGIVVNAVDGPLAALCQHVGQALVMHFGALSTTLFDDGSVEIVHRTGRHAADKIEDDLNLAPAAGHLTCPPSPQRRQKVRKQWIDGLRNGNLQDPKLAVKNLAGERLICLGVFDREGFAVLDNPALKKHLGPVRVKDIAQLAAQVSLVEALFNARGLRDRIEAFPAKWKNELFEAMPVLERAQLQLVLGIWWAAIGSAKQPFV